MPEEKDNIIPDRDISAEVEALRDGILRDIEMIHKETYEEIKEIMRKYKDKRLENSND